MARNRLLKKDFFADPKVGSLPLGGRLLFEALWINSDDTGHGIADTRLLKAQAFAYDTDITPEMVEIWLRAMTDSRMILLYEVENQRYYWVRNFDKHQVISHPSKFEYPKLATPARPDNSSSIQGVLAEHSESTPPQSKSERVKSTVTKKEKENDNGERKGKADPDGQESFVSPDDRDLTLKADRKSCAKKTDDYLAFCGLDKKQMGRSFTQEFKVQIASAFIMYRIEVHDASEPCCCSSVDFLERVIERCSKNEVRYPKGLIRVKREMEARERNAS